ncbi:hypothetical protein ACET3Z_024844 [Daucus carota]
MAHGYKVNLGKMIMAQLRSAIIRKVSVYPRFITMFFNNVCGIAANASNTRECFVLKKNTHTTLINSNPHSDITLHYTKHMSDQVTNLGSSFKDNPFIFSFEDEARINPTQANLHYTPYTLSRTLRLPKSLQKAQTVPQKRTIEVDEVDSGSVEGETTLDAANKDGNIKEPTIRLSDCGVLPY